MSRRRLGAKVNRTARAGRVVQAKPKGRDGSRPDINAEIRRLQRTAALLGCIQIAAAEGAKLDMADALKVVCDRVELSLQGLDRLEVAMHAGSESRAASVGVGQGGATP